MGASLIPLLTQIIAAAPGWIKAGIDAVEMWNNVDRVISENAVVGDADWEALAALRDARKAEFEAAARD
jgi:hypothetical protein